MVGQSYWRSVELANGLLEETDCVVILTAHSSYNWESVAKSANLMLDIRNMTNGISSKKIHKL